MEEVEQDDNGNDDDDDEEEEGAEEAEEEEEEEEEEEGRQEKKENRRKEKKEISFCCFLKHLLKMYLLINVFHSTLIAHDVWDQKTAAEKTEFYCYREKAAQPANS